MSGAAFVMLTEGIGVAVSAPAFTVTTGPGINARAFAGSYIFPTNTAVASGGTGPYTYLWIVIPDSGGTWTLTNAGTATVGIKAVVGPGGGSNAILTCTATDTATGKTVTTSGIFYSYQSTNDN